MRARAATTSMVVGLIAAILAAACGQKHDPAPQPTPVRIQVVESASDVGSQRYSANVRPDVQVDVAFKVGGYVDSILAVRGVDGRMRSVQDGDFVHKGIVVAHVRDGEYRDRLSEAQASLTQARASYDRAARMYENHTIAKAEYDAAYASAASSQARYDQAALTLQDCSLLAPIDGWVMRRSVEIGTLVAAGTPGFTVADTRSVKVVFGVPDVVVNTLHLGDEQTITADAFPGESCRGRLTRIAPSADPTSRAFEVECTIPNPKNALKVGMIATLVTTSQAVAQPAALVPLNAVVRPKDDPRGYAVFVIEDRAGKSTAALRTVKLGDVVGNAIAVSDGLRRGERVVVTGATLVVDGQEVRIVP